MLYSAACLLLLASIAFAGTPSAGLTKRQSDSCDIGYAVCLPDVSGTNADPYSVVYDDTYTLIYALLGIVGIADATSKVKRATVQAGLCCSTDVTVDCLLLTDVDIPFCYDESTTEFVFSDGSFGYVDTGDYFDQGGDALNFYTGDYAFSNGSTGNIYSQANTTPPNTATLTIPRRTGTVASLPPTAVAGGKPTGTGSASLTKSVISAAATTTIQSTALTRTTGLATSKSTGAAATQGAQYAMVGGAGIALAAALL
ncbi:MAG: hypothetical protein M1824_005308 [Vezdaea acicularis]|nr:MAG: hypothetical protein M1824_005308 [Vezdaea acicularis]